LIYCGIDWAERTHDVALVDDSGQLLAKRHITDNAAGYRVLLDLLAEYGDSEENPIPVAIETSRGLLVAVLRTGKRKVFAINPMSAARYRDRHSVSRKKALSRCWVCGCLTVCRGMVGHGSGRPVLRPWWTDRRCR
jgi:transposase